MENIRHDYFNISEGVEDSGTRNLLKNLISFKNSIPRYNLSFYPISNEYITESKQYLQGLIYLNITTIYIAILALASFIVFISCRVCCKRCGATLTNYKFSITDHTTLKVRLILMAGVFLCASVAALTGEIGYYASIRRTGIYMDEQAVNLTSDSEFLYAFISNINELGLQMDDYRDKYGYLLNVDMSFLDEILME
mmetsp:Transcript_28219/g.27183  ORF Transcript_28219/g.27183 Transcript_28219/m.27183 type:complete len:196 (+) Transcript_28219:131-718(+)